MAKRASVTSKTNQAFKNVDVRMTEAERTMRETHEKVLETLQAVFDRFGQWHARQEEILRRIEALEAAQAERNGQLRLFEQVDAQEQS